MSETIHRRIMKWELRKHGFLIFDFGEKAFYCTICDQKVSKITHFKQHIAEHEEIEQIMEAVKR